MRDIPDLFDGYTEFLTDKYPAQADLYRSLAETGQKPKMMIIACCDSRAGPAVIFNAGPGEIFVVRNVANLVPPHEPHGDYHSTSPALEFAVEGIGVETVLVMDHARCGGIKAFLSGIYESTDTPCFIGRWMSLLNPARSEALRDIQDDPIERQQEALEHAAIRHSIENLKTYPLHQGAARRRQVATTRGLFRYRRRRNAFPRS